MNGDPLALFHEWVEGTEVVLATAARDGHPSARMLAATERMRARSWSAFAAARASCSFCSRSSCRVCSNCWAIP